MVDVVKWPPVGLTAFEISKVDPVSVSKTLINSRPFVSRFGRSRRVATNVVTGFGYDSAGSGYMEMFKEYLEGGSNLIRLDITSGIWHFVRAGNNPLLSNALLEWTSNGGELVWTTGGTELLWFEKGIVATSKAGESIIVTGLPPNTTIVRPHEIVSIYVNGVKESRRVRKVSKSNPSGIAQIFTKGEFSGVGPVILGDSESVVFRVDGMLPRAVQPQIGEWTYEWSLTEAFEDEYDAWIEVDPWG